LHSIANQRKLFASYCKRLDKGEVPLGATRAITQTRGGVGMTTVSFFLDKENEDKLTSD
jgi:hypothetical protein